MKELSFEIKVPAFFENKSGLEKMRVVVSAIWFFLSVYLKLKFDLPFLETLILVYFGLALVWTLTSRISATLALFFLVCCPILLILKNDSLAETSAVFAYYFLVITVVQEIFELKKAPKRSSKSPVDNFSGQVKRKIV